MRLKNPTNFELNCAFARYIEKVDERLIDCVIACGPDGSIGWSYANNANMVLAFLNDREVEINNFGGEWKVEVYGKTTHTVRFTGEDSSFARAAMIALLRANGVKIDFTT